MAVAAAASAASCPRAFVVVSHRGDSAGAPENTLPAFDQALSQGFAHFETDAQLSRDGVPVVLHDETLGRTNDGSGPASAASLAQLQQLDAGAWFGPAFAGTRVPTLEQVLVRYSGRAHIHLELKSKQQQLPAAVAMLVRQHGWVQALPQQRQQQQQAPPAGAAAGAGAAAADPASLFLVPGLTITSFHLEALQASQQLLPEVTHGWLIQEVTPDIIATATQCRFGMVCPRANALTREGVQQLCAQGFAVRAWGVKSLELLHHVVACGVHGATVNWPKQAAEALRLAEEEQGPSED